MDKDDLLFQICRTSDELKSAQDGQRAVLEGLGRNITVKTGNAELGKPLAIFVRNAEKIVGGVVGHVFGGWVYIALLWVEESLRNKGNGTRLLRMMEEEAARLGCRNAHLDTFSFEAKPFYEKNGYELFATLENYPEGHSKHFLKKKLPQ